MPSTIIRSTPVRLTVILSAVFLLGLAVAGVVAFGLVRQELAVRIDQSVSDTYAIIAAAYNDGDVGDLTESVTSHSAPIVGDDQVYLLQDRSGTRLAGNLPLMTFHDGWSTVTPQTAGDSEPSADYRVFSGIVDGYRLTVGKSLSEADEIGLLMLTAFAWAGAGLIVLVSATGAVIAMNGQRRLGQVSAAMDQVGRGDLQARIPISRRNDDIDHIGREVNTALDRLVALVEGMRQVSVDIAHELKTPLNRLGIAIEAALEGLSRGTDIEPQLEQAQAEGRVINATFDALLRIAQIESGARRARFTDLDLAPLLETIEDAFEPVAAENQQSLTLASVPKLPAVHGDSDLLTQLVANLVENAMRHCPPGSSICLSASTVNGRTQLRVTDTGPGIPEAEREKVFRRLYRLEKSRTTSGSGLGLALVKAICELHGAHIELGDNAPGLIVSITFPPNQEASRGS